MKLTYHGHSCFEFLGGGHRLIVDPFLTGNPLANVRADEIQVDTILVTHGHNDHVGDTIEIAKRNNAQVIAPFELATWLGWQGLQTHGMGVGGSSTFPFGNLEQTVALHGSGYVSETEQQIIYMGAPGGYLLTLEEITIYHAGDTALFSDMRLLSSRQIDVALLPIGDHFTMGPRDAVQAAEWLNPKCVIPMHYNTFPMIQQDPYLFVERLEEKGICGKVLSSGESFCIES